MQKLLYFFALLLIVISCSEDTEEEVTSPPNARFEISKSPNNFYAGSGFVVTDYSTNADQITWDFGDGTTSSTSVVTHSYQQKGDYLITLEACNGDVCETTEMLISVKDSVSKLLSNNSSKTWVLTSWRDDNGNSLGFDSCLSCIYAQTFYDQVTSEGKHKWLNTGLRVCGDETLQCSTYGPQGHGFFELDFEPSSESNFILIGLAMKEGYEIVLEEERLYLKSMVTLDELVYERR